MKTKSRMFKSIGAAGNPFMVLMAMVWVLTVHGNNKKDALSDGLGSVVPSCEIQGDGNHYREKDLPEYVVSRIASPLVIDANWEKPQWHRIKSIEITNLMGKRPRFFPRTEVKMAYNNEYLYIIFRVRDKFVQSLIQKVNGPVYEDSAVEFFFSADPSRPREYFDLEINCGGTPLICYVPVTEEFAPGDIKKIGIAHSLPAAVYPELKKEVTWTVECKIPFRVLEKFADISLPGKGVCWKGNFFKTASKGSNPHYLTWAPVKNPKPNFHLPQFFGRLRFN
jgi:hypothetical protein